MTPNKKRKTTKRQSNKMLMLAIGIIAIITIGIGAYAMLGQNNQNGIVSPTPTPTPSATPTPNPNVTSTRVLLQTTAGNITIELRDDKPITSGNFKNLVEQGMYDGSTFHRTISTFMIQGGKVSGSVSSITDEIGSNNHNTKYTIAMAKTNQPNSATSEFFINTADNSQIIYPDGTRFDATYAVFGTVIEGRAVVDTIANAPVTADPYTGEMSVPVNPIIIITATILS